MKYFAMGGAWKCQLDCTCLSCTAEGTVSNPSPVKPEATCKISAEKLDGLQSHQSEPSALHCVPANPTWLCMWPGEGWAEAVGTVWWTINCFISATSSTGQPGARVL